MTDFDVDLAFVTEDRLRILLDDYSKQARSAYEAGAYLGTLVACGGIVEGLLVWALSLRGEEALCSPGAQKDGDGKVLPIEKWNLSKLINVAVRLELLGKTAKDASWAVKEFRNFIHPCNLLTQSARANEALATSAMSAVTEISRSLRGRLAK